MNVPQLISQKCYDKVNEEIVCATKSVVTTSMRSAATEEENVNNSRNICVSGEGTLKRRGHTS